MNRNTQELKRTPLASLHESIGAKMIPFASFWMPASYGSILEEHNAVRQKVGIFDVSHMGEIIISGSGAKEFINSIITNDCSKLRPGAIQYTVMCHENGTVIDDLLVYAIEEEKFLLVVNAVNTLKDLQHFQSCHRSGLHIEDASDRYALLAVQGPLSRDVLHACPIFAPVLDDLDKIPYYHFLTFSRDGTNILVSRTGYTGELGFEIFVAPSLAVAIWEAIITAGKPFGIVPVGLAARDTLRFEASYCLYGQELDVSTTPIQAGLGWVVKLGKPDFIGRGPLVEEKRLGPKKILIGLELDGRAIARQGFAVMVGERVVGKVTSGHFAPTLKKSLCMAFVESGEARDTDHFTVEIRSKGVEAHRTPLPFYKSRAK